jgi:hypothetical protein
MYLVKRTSGSEALEFALATSDAAKRPLGGKPRSVVSEKRHRAKSI